MAHFFGLFLGLQLLFALCCIQRVFFLKSVTGEAALVFLHVGLHPYQELQSYGSTVGPLCSV